MTVMPSLVTNGYAAISLPDGRFHVVYYEGTPEEVRRQVDEAAAACGGRAPSLKAEEL